MSVCRAMAVCAGLAVVSLIAGCGSSSNSSGSSSAGTPQRGGNLVFARTSDIITFDRTEMFDNESTWTSDLMFETLYKPTNDGSKDVPWLATSYSVSPNKLVWTFHLRPGVKFSDGKPLTANDVKFSLDTTRAPSSGWAFIDAAIKNVAAPNPETVVVTTKYPWSPLLSDMSIFPNGIIPANYNNEPKAQFLQHPIGTGPFMMGTWVKGQYLKLVRNPYYWQTGKPYLNSVTFTAVPDDNTRIDQLEGGTADLIEFPPFSSVKSLQSQPNITVKPYPIDRVDALFMNEAKPPFNNVWLRRAITLAINRSAIVKALLFGFGQPANSFLPNHLAFYNPQDPSGTYNPAEAKADLAKSPYAHGVTVNLMITGGNLVQSEMAQIVQSDLKPLGINVNIQQLDQNTVNTDMSNGDYSFGYQYYTSDVVDADELINILNIFGSHYTDPVFYKLIKEAAASFNEAERVKLYDEAQDVVAKDAGLVTLWFQPDLYAYSNNVHGFVAGATGDYELQNVWLSK